MRKPTTQKLFYFDMWFAIKVDWLYLRKNNLTLCIGTGILPCENNYQMLQTVENLHFLQIAIHYQALNS